MTTRFLQCRRHGKQEWDGEVVCECGVVHRMTDGGEDHQCECGRSWQKWLACCKDCYASCVAAGKFCTGCAAKAVN